MADSADIDDDELAEAERAEAELREIERQHAEFALKRKAAAQELQAKKAKIAERKREREQAEALEQERLAAFAKNEDRGPTPLTCILVDHVNPCEEGADRVSLSVTGSSDASASPHSSILMTDYTDVLLCLEQI